MPVAVARSLRSDLTSKACNIGDRVDETTVNGTEEVQISGTRCGDGVGPAAAPFAQIRRQRTGERVVREQLRQIGSIRMFGHRIGHDFLDET